MKIKNNLLKRRTPTVRGGRYDVENPSYNRPVYASPPVGGLGLRSPRSVGLRPRSHGSLHPQFLALVFASQSPYPG